MSEHNLSRMGPEWDDGDRDHLVEWMTDRFVRMYVKPNGFPKYENVK